MTVKDDKTEKWSAALVRIENDAMAETLYSLDSYSYKSDYDAASALHQLIERSLENIQIMSN